MVRSLGEITGFQLRRVQVHLRKPPHRGGPSEFRLSAFFFLVLSFNLILKVSSGNNPTFSIPLMTKLVLE
jgi:hypothetical protein